MKRRKKLLSFMLTTAMCLLALASIAPGKAYAANKKRITVKEFAKELANEIGLNSKDGVAALKEAGIIKEGDFTNYNNHLRRGDATMLVSRADEYLNGDNVDPDLVEFVIERRISDIDEMKEDKREDIAKGYIKGFMKCYSNGAFTQDRELRGNNRITKKGARNIIKMVTDKSKRALISPDGQLIRTTNLPKNAEQFPYILATFPNKFYEYALRYERVGSKYTFDEDGNIIEIILQPIENYAPPVDLDKITYYGENFVEIKDELIQEWEDKVRTHLELVLNVDYRTIDDEWVDALEQTVIGFDQIRMPWVSKDGEAYAKRMKENKTIVESQIAAVDKSTLYYTDDSLYIRAYVKFRILSSNTSFKDENERDINVAYNNVIYSDGPTILREHQLGEWIEFPMEVELANAFMKGPESIAVSRTLFLEGLYESNLVK